jgi:hypothetical protein
MATKLFSSLGSAALCCAAMFSATSASLGASGVCCIPGLTCTILDSSLCTGGGRVYKGDGTTCTPNPCVPPRGACCIRTSRVTIPPYTGGEVTTLASMMTDAAPPTKGIQSNPGPVNWIVDPIICVVIPELNCTSNGGTYHGDNTACIPYLCTPPAQIPGACCVTTANGTVLCLTRIQADCAIGIFTPNAACTPTFCPPAVLGGCCRADYCFSAAAVNCNATGAHYLGDNVACTTTNCPPPVHGTCCRPGGTFYGAYCNVEFSNSCIGPGAVFNATQTTCNGANCPGSCPCDWNGDGYLTSADLVAFTNDYLAGHADFNHDGATNAADVTAFNQCFNGGFTPGCFRH